MRSVRDRAIYRADPTYDCYWLWAGKGISLDMLNRYYGELPADHGPTPWLGEVTPPVLLAVGRLDYGNPYTL
jgi:hypothetical protein